MPRREQPAPRQEKYWKMYHEEGLSGYQIARREGVSRGTVYDGLERERLKRLRVMDRISEEAGEASSPYLHEVAMRPESIDALVIADKALKRKLAGVQTKKAPGVREAIAEWEAEQARLVEEAKDHEATREPKATDRIPSPAEVKAEKAERERSSGG